mgnify:CR=1 FL=1
MKEVYIVRCGDGYFVGFTKSLIPITTSDPELAIRFVRGGGANVVARIKEELGLEAEEIGYIVTE